MITAKVVCDSIGPEGVRLTTVEARYNRYIHSEFMTHRVFSRNASSSRAIPSKRIRAAVKNDPARPVFWGKNQAGMQANEELRGWRRGLAERLFMGSRHIMLLVVWALECLGLHKQLANRLLEPWSHITVVMTATEWANFFALRINKDAQPEMRALAYAIQRAMDDSIPERLLHGEWHLPYVQPWERKCYPYWKLIQLSVARCARVSYLKHDGGTSTWQEDCKLHDRLVQSGHMSPTEHQATPGDAYPYQTYPYQTSNLRGWVQYRKTLPDEAVFARGA